ncbi:tRNA (guanine(10)-N2)-methyltransferase homolog isoform X2 [Bacillus rossius redtenbacheri]|uniref:tRNA (guanine(10)-N2)-methyltransferase homolog isoform X2 n=1 Tax=Bacillus rossius redtenbacheri TaxID=93214 RepID=UPI002FDD2A0C
MIYMRRKMSMKKYLLWFANEHVEFRLPEIESLLSLYNIHYKWLHQEDNHPFWVLELPSESVARQVAGRSVSLHGCVELWAHASTEEELHGKLRALPAEQFRQHFCPGKSFRIKVDTFCNKLSQAQKINKIENFSYLPIEGHVNLKDPDICLNVIEYYGQDSNNIPEKPLDLYFGRWVASGQRDLLARLSLKTRKFIGNTSMDPQLSILMANQARIVDGDLVLDPFVGSGSLLVAAAHFGGYVLGTDIDYLMLHGRTRPSRIQSKKHREEDESVRANMEQYGMIGRYLDVIVADSSLPIWHDSLTLDAIITDPPYGIREATERLGSTKNYTISEHHLETHIPSKVEYGLQHMYTDLLQFAVRHLREGGRLVCWVPVVRETYCEEKLPSHPCLKLVYNCEQVLTSYTSRRLITLEKTHEPDEVQHCVASETSAGEFRAKFFRYGEEVRKLRKLRKALAARQERPPASPVPPGSDSRATAADDSER